MADDMRGQEDRPLRPVMGENGQEDLLGGSTRMDDDGKDKAGPGRNTRNLRLDA